MLRSVSSSICARVPREHRAAPASRKVATKEGTKKIRQKNGRVHAREAGEGTGTQEKKTRGNGDVGWTIGGEKGRKAGRKMKSMHAATFSTETEGARETEGPTGGTGGRNEKGWKKIRRSVDRTP